MDKFQMRAMIKEEVKKYKRSLAKLFVKNSTGGLNIDDLKCCGNCELVFSMSDCPYPDNEDCRYCDSWKFDGMKQKDRRIK